MNNEMAEHVTRSALRWRHNDHAGVSNHQPHGCLLNRLFRRKSKKISKLRVTGLCAGNSPGTGEFPAQMASHAENVSIWWRHHGIASTHRLYHAITSGITYQPIAFISPHQMCLHDTKYMHREEMVLHLWWVDTFMACCYIYKNPWRP